MIAGRKSLAAIAAGLLTDIIALAGDPLADVNFLEDVRFVMQGGVAYKTPQ